jgi:hypothetical protein
MKPKETYENKITVWKVIKFPFKFGAWVIRICIYVVAILTLGVMAFTGILLADFFVVRANQPMQVKSPYHPPTGMTFTEFHQDRLANWELIDQRLEKGGKQPHCLKDNKNNLVWGLALNWIEIVGSGLKYSTQTGNWSVWTLKLADSWWKSTVDTVWSSDYTMNKIRDGCNLHNIRPKRMVNQLTTSP